MKEDMMDRYIDQLIEDMQAAAVHVKPPGELWDTVDLEDEGEVEDMAFAEEYIYGTPHPLSEIVGIATIKLPPLHRLTARQAARLYAAMQQLLNAHRFVPDFPEGLPEALKYQLLRERWDDDQVAIGAGEVHMEFCDNEPDTCPFPEEYCACKAIQTEIAREEREGPKWEGPDLDPEDLLPF